jgi:hypothetical protein
MAAWIAGIHQVRGDASGDVRVDLDSSAPCWNDATARALLEVTEVSSAPYDLQRSTKDLRNR